MHYIPILIIQIKTFGTNGAAGSFMELACLSKIVSLMCAIAYRLKISEP